MASTFASYFGQRSTIAYTTVGTTAPAGSLYTVSTNVGPAWLNTLTVSSFTTLVGSTITVSTLRYNSTTVSLGQSTNQSYTTLGNGSYTITNWVNSLGSLTSTTKVAINQNASNILVTHANSSTINATNSTGAAWTSLTGSNGLPVGSTAYPLAAAGTPNFTSISQSATGQYVLASVSGGLLYTSANSGTNWSPTGGYIGTPTYYIPLDGSVIDLNGNSAPTITGSISYVTGQTNTPAGNFIGNAANIANTAGGIPNNYIRGTIPAMTNFTISLAVNVQSSPSAGNGCSIFSLGTNSQTFLTIYYANAITFNSTNYSGFLFQYYNSGNGAVVIANLPTVSLNTWYNLSLSFSTTGNAYAYVNGILIGSSVGAALLNTMTTYSIGSVCHAAFSGFNGYMDDVRIYNSIPAINTNPPIVYMPFEGATTDLMAGTTVSVSGSITYTTSANAAVGSQAAVFANTAGNTANNFIRGSWTGSPNFSASFWFNLQSLGAIQTLFSAYGTALYLYVSASNVLTWSFPSGGGTSGSTITGPTLTSGTWYNVTFIFQTGGTCSLYLNNALIGSSTNVSGVGSRTTTFFALGTYDLPAYGQAFNGYIDDFRFYNTAVTFSPIAPMNWTQTAMSSTGQYMLAAATTGGLFLSSNYGNTWTMVTAVGRWGGVAMSASGQYMFGCSTVANYAPYYSTNYGATWTNTTFEGLTATFAAISGNGQYSLTGYTTTARIVSNYLLGYTSTTYTTPTLPSINANIVSGAFSGTGQYMVIITQGTTNNVYYSTNYGATFTGTTIGALGMVSCAISYDGSYIVVSSVTTVYTLNLNSAGYSVALGTAAGVVNQGLNAVAIGNSAGTTNQAAGSIVLNGTGSALNAYMPGFFVAPVATTASSSATSVSVLGYGADSQITQTSVSVLPNGYVGIGTTNPGSALHLWSQSVQNVSPVLTLSGSSAIQGSGPRIDMYGFYNATTPQSRIETYDDGNYGGWIVLSTKGDGSASGALRETFRCGGPNNYVGIGTASPASLLHVAGTATAAQYNMSLLTIGDSGLASELTNILNLSLNYRGTTNAANIGAAFRIDGRNNSSNGTSLFQWNYKPVGASESVLMVLNSSGQLGVGTPSPTYPIHVYTGNALTLMLEQSTTTANYMSFKSNGTVYGYFGLETSTGIGLFGNNTGYGMSIGTPTATNFNISTNNAVRMTVASSGYVGIGTTTPAYPFTVYGNGGAYAPGGNNPYLQSPTIGVSNTTVYGAVGAWFQKDVIAGGAIGTFSDQRIKNNIQPVTNALATIEQLHMVSHGYIDQIENPQSCSVGLIAQEVRKVIPDAVSLVTNFIPNIMCMPQLATLLDDAIELTFDHPIDLCVTDLIRLILKDRQVEQSVLFVNHNVIRVSAWSNADPINDQIFVYGKQVADFHILDKPKMGLLALAGVKELAFELRSENTALKSKIEALESTLEMVLARLSAAGIA